MAPQGYQLLLLLLSANRAAPELACNTEAEPQTPRYSMWFDRELHLTAECSKS
jgi:hypothetical protein